MYVHIGEDTLVRAEAIIAIISRESAVTSEDMIGFFGHNRASIVDLSKGSYKSLVVTKDVLYYSPLSSGTLKKRSWKQSIQEYDY